LGLACATALLGAGAPAASAVQCSTQHWVGSWAASPSNASTSRTSVAHQTIRMIVHPTLGGSQLRIRLSNRHGTGPITLSAVTVGRRAAGAALVAGSVHAVTFDGRRPVTIPAGGEAASDPVDMSITAFEDLAVSVYVDATISRPTEHFITRETNYITLGGAGDHTADAGGAAFGLKTSGVNSTGWYFLDGVDVLTPSSVGSVVAFGDSLTDGYEGLDTTLTENFTGVGANARYPDYLAQRLAAAGRTELAVLNAGISGNQLLADSDSAAEYGRSGLSRFGADVLAQPGVSAVLILIGINDLGRFVPPANVIAGLQRLIAQAHARGLRVILGTIPPTGGTSLSRTGHFYDTTSNISREAVNQWIRSPTGAESVADFDAALRDPSDPSRLRPVYDSSDHIHPSEAGYQAMADAVDLSGLAGPACSGPDVLPQKTRLTVTGRFAGRGRTLRARGRLVVPGKVSCPKARIVIGLYARGRLLAHRRAALSATCRFSASLPVARSAPKALSLRVSYAGSSLLSPARRTLSLRRSQVETPIVMRPR
jgi:lysophospholipase L1-like esterase